MKIRLTFSLGLLLALQFAAIAQLKVSRLFTDHAVLQRNKPIIVWGWGKPAAEVAVSIAGRSAKTSVAQDGKWRLELPSLPAGGPHVLKISSDYESKEIIDVMIGEVWLCSGQSNMEWPVRQADNFQQEKSKAQFKDIRQFFVNHEVSLEPQSELLAGNWVACSPETVGDFTAVGYFFARELHQKLNVPIGLVHSSWGGSQIEGWISKQGMSTHPELASYASNLPKNWEAADAFHGNKLMSKLLGSSTPPTRMEEARYLASGYDFSNWHHGGSPLGQWDWKGIWAFRGTGYMARAFELTEEFAKGIAYLGLAQQDSFNEVYLNGKLVFAGIQKGTRRIELPQASLKPGTNRLVVKFSNMVELPWFGLGLLGNPSDLYIESSFKERLSLSDEWKLMPSFAEPHQYVHSSNNIGTSIFNAMIAPLIPFSMKGVLWYQGETNASRAFQYRSTFPLLIQDWRNQWKDDFSFYFVQLSSFGANQSSNKGSNWAELREAQTMTLRVPNTGMAVSIDVGNPQDIHPTDKQTVGYRLAIEALKKDFGIGQISQGPTFKSMSTTKVGVALEFDNVGTGLTVKDTYGYLRGFEVASDDRVFYYAKAEISNNRVLIRHPKGAKIASVRYAWSDSPIDANLFNLNGLPAVPFRTDQWEGITTKSKFD